MLEKLVRQTALYGVSTIVTRLFNYLLTPYYTRIFSQETYGIVVDVYALIPLFLVLLTMGMETSYFRFSTKFRESGQSPRRLFSTMWGATLAASMLFLALVVLFKDPIAAGMGAAYVAHPDYVLLVGGIVFLDVAAMLPFCRLREQGRAVRFITFKSLNILFSLALNLAFGLTGLFATDFGVGWVFVANLIASAATLILVTPRILPRIDPALLKTIFVYSLPLLLSGLAGTATEFIDRQMIKYLAPADAMAQLGLYGAVTKVAVVMTLFTQVYRYAAEPFFLSGYKQDEFKQMNAAALKYFVLVSMVLFLGIGLFKDVFGLIVGHNFRESMDILPVFLGANVLSGVWLNLSFWYKRQERTLFALVVTVSGLVVSLAAYPALVPALGLCGAAWGRLATEAAMVAVSLYLNRRFFPTPYDLKRMGEYIGLALVAFALGSLAHSYVVSAALLLLYGFYALKREHLNPFKR